MKTLFEIRAANLARIAEQFGSKSELARRVGRQPQSVGGIINGTRNCGNTLAREFEAMLGLAQGTLDREGAEIDVLKSSPTVPFVMVPRLPQEANVGLKPTAPAIPRDEQKLLFSALDVAALGAPAAPKRSVYIRMIEADKNWLYAQSAATDSVQSIRVISAASDNMAPIVRPHAVLLVDTAQTLLNASGIFVVQYSGSVFIHRVQVLPGGKYRLLSDNPAYPPIDADASSSGGVKIVGRCVMVLNPDTL